jgi:peptidyl-prolyl cis-trans isomerase B (cyclophilin B)
MRALLLALVLLALAAGCGGDDGDDGEASGNGAGTEACESVTVPEAREPGEREAPQEPLAGGQTYELVFETSCGSFTVTLDPAKAPKTSASLVALARDGYFDDTIFHRIVPGFVIQGGDPTQQGSGGPGYTTVDVPPSGSNYTKGIVAMAKSAAEPPGAAGSQFFVVTAEEAALPLEYAIVGEVTEGLEVVERIGALGDPVTEQPTQPIVVETITVEES